METPAAHFKESTLLTQWKRARRRGAGYGGLKEGEYDIYSKLTFLDASPASDPRDLFLSSHGSNHNCQKYG